MLIYQKIKMIEKITALWLIKNHIKLLYPNIIQDRSGV